MACWMEAQYGRVVNAFSRLLRRDADLKGPGGTAGRGAQRGLTPRPQSAGDDAPASPGVQTLSAIIPAKNEGEILLEVAEAVKKYCDELIIVDGHSTDGSAEVARQRGFTVLTDHGLGKGDAVRCGVEAATGDVVVIMDADGSHDPDDIPALVAPIREAKADLVIGCRMTGGSDEFAGTWELFIRLWGNNFLTMLCNTRFGVALTDSQNGFRAARLAMLRELQLQENKHTIEFEIVLKALKKQYKVCQVPTHEYCRRAGVSSLSVRKQLPHFLRCLCRNIW
jgi:glycosyltransferase involved in cell wall biosynthesis